MKAHFPSATDSTAKRKDPMHTILILGAGKMGSILAHLLVSQGNYQVTLADNAPKLDKQTQQIIAHPHIQFTELDITHAKALAEIFNQQHFDAVVSSLPYFLNLPVAKAAKAAHCHYFDLTEDTQTTDAIIALSQNSKTAFVGQCGLAPGFIDIIANDLISHFDTIDTVKLRCGALPLNSSNALQYALTWSTDGLINEYANPCHALENSKEILVPPLDGLEEIQIDGLMYEAFNTSGGIGSLANTHLHKVKNMNYKSIRYPGHCEKMRFLMQDLKLNDDRDTLKRILENAIPATVQDVVLIYVSVNGHQQGKFMKEAFVKKYYPKKLNAIVCSAIQMTTTSGIACIIDLILQNPQRYHGFVRQEDFSLESLFNNPFGAYLRGENERS